MELTWFIGYLEGEGTFVMCFIKSSLYRLGICVEPRFAISVNQKDAKVIDKIGELLNSFNIKSYITKRKTHKDWGPNASNQVVITVYGIKNCQKFFRLISGKLESSKSGEIELWGRMLDILTQKPLTKDKISEIAELNDRLCALRTPHGKRKWTKQTIMHSLK